MFDPRFTWWTTFPGAPLWLSIAGQIAVAALYLVLLRCGITMFLIWMEQRHCHNHQWQGTFKRKGDAIRYFLAQNSCGCRYSHSLLNPLNSLTEEQRRSVT